MDKETIKRCSVFISNNLPGYVICDLSEDAIVEAIEEGNLEYDNKEKSFIYKQQIDREVSNSFYPQMIADQLEHIVDYFLECDLYKENVQPVQTLVG